MVARRLRAGQTFRSWDRFVLLAWLLLELLLIQWILHLLGIKEIHLRRSFLEIALLVFVIPSFILNLSLGWYARAQRSATVKM